jgi:DNA-binding SARP family transcriptional activator
VDLAVDRPMDARVTLLDGFALRLPGCRAADGADELPRGVQRLVAYLSLCRRPARTAIAGELWPEVPEDNAHRSLRSALWRLQKVAPGLVEVSGGALSLARTVRVDVRELSEWAQLMLDPHSRADAEAVPDVGLRGELLPGWYDEWVLLERERLRQLRMHALEALAEKLAAAGRYGEAVQAAYAAVVAEPLRESAHRAVVRVHLVEGNLAEALRAYDAFRTLLAEELGVAPSSQMDRLVCDLPRPRAPRTAERSARVTMR